MERIRWLYGFLACILIAILLAPLQIMAQGEFRTSDQPLVYYIPVEQEVERGLEAFLQRSLDSAVEEGADHIVLEINTPGGRVDAAGNMARALRETDIPITAYVIDQALSAGAYIALNADEIVMAPGSTMGSAAVIDSAGNAADEKAQSYWLAEMRNAAEYNDRDPKYALAMADRSIEIPELDISNEELLTLTASQALEVNYAEAIASNRAELLEHLQIDNAFEQEMEVSFAEKLARFVTNPLIIPILLSIGSLGLVLELYSPGFGVPGIMGISALLLFFFGHLIAGFAGYEAMILFIAGFLLILIEVFMPGFGLFGILGIAGMIGGMLLASFSTAWMLVSLGISAVVTTVVAIITFRYFGSRGPWKKMILTESTSSEKGYITNETRQELVGLIGQSLTPLRPSGSGLFGEERLDVVSEGGYIEQGRKIKVVSTSGSRIVVRETDE
ncbi:NfeD family protein [Halalkalibacterium halodurans]|uniref:BH1356 protein n=2 Tax=Halalkalibacterium halodurans TaxID=86665 RepID=Q9KD63_HALH5|nr:nodulation protein NfeD [Halalkalibacterium halodurans]MDY7221881.1 nodulation protein NfeD [Halalkalibacterium halodurans]MDY7241157.1 nodulation protein NfeD [Halalkalibacterium halodurans]MED4122531.1 nodulation protein NfeD [Halalkalibacterium halodurans]MED4173620.1 nodulation protein NfeD [Halalkalibacterium halodurans]TES56652.1 nodulation protein NfeD [Halalkalibacterium halodurans]